MAIMKRKGERGSPCRSPLEEWKDPVGDILRSIENLAEVIQLLIIFIQYSKKPRSLREERNIRKFKSSKVI